MIEHLDRGKVTFSQAEGIEALPSPLKLKEVSQELRSKLWRVLHESIMASIGRSDYGKPRLRDPWNLILYDHFTLILHKMADDYESNFDKQHEFVGSIIKIGDYNQIFDFIQFVLRHRNCPYGLWQDLQWALQGSRAAYRVVDEKTIAPISNVEEGKAVIKAFQDLRDSQFSGGLQHLRNAAHLLTAGKDSDSIRESINAVESVARKIDPDANRSLGYALNALEKLGLVAPVLKSGFEKLYGYTNAEEGIRHPLLDKGASSVDAADAQFMFGACASFISYLIAKARTGKIIE